MINDLINKQSSRFWNMFLEAGSNGRSTGVSIFNFEVDGKTYSMSFRYHRTHYRADLSDDMTSRYTISIGLKIDGILNVNGQFHGQMRAGTRSIVQLKHFDPDSFKCEATLSEKYSEQDLEHILVMLFLTCEQVE